MFRRAQILDQLADELRVIGGPSQAAHCAIRPGNHNGHRVDMDIQSKESCLFFHDRLDKVSRGIAVRFRRGRRATALSLAWLSAKF